jgi:hypothetical protein
MKNEVQIIPLSDIDKMATAIGLSGLFGVKDKNQALALMFVAQAEGLHPATVARDYHIIKGRPALKADAILGRFQSSGGCVNWPKYTETEVTGIFSHPKGGAVEITWSIEMAKKAGLTGNDTWNKYPRQMLRARCISEGVRTVFPSITSGFYTVEEAQDMDIAPEYRKPIPTDATIIPDKKKKELTPDHPRWQGAKKAIKEGTISLEHLKNVYEITPENEAKLLETETQTTETSEGNQNESI